jgi:hypothetical protein
MVGSNVRQRTADPSAILNAICREGWGLLSSPFVFVEMGQQSRDKFLSSGQNVATRGSIVGYYVFRRREPNTEDSEDGDCLPVCAKPSS